MAELVKLRLQSLSCKRQFMIECMPPGKPANTVTLVAITAASHAIAGVVLTSTERCIKNGSK